MKSELIKNALTKVVWLKEPTPIGIKPFRKRVLLLSLCGLTSNIVFFYLYQLSNELHLTFLYYLSISALIVSNILFPILYSLSINDRIEDSIGNAKSKKGFFLNLLALLPWVGLYFVYTLATKEKIPAGYLKKRIPIFILLTSMILIPFRYQDKILQNPKHSSAKNAHLLRSVLYDHSPMFMRFTLNIINEASVIWNLRDGDRFDITNCKNVTLEVESNNQMTCLLEQIEFVNDKGPRKTNTFYVLAMAVDAAKVFKEKQRFSKDMISEENKNIISANIALRLIENQYRIRTLSLKRKRHHVVYNTPYLTYLPGSTESILIFLVEEIIQTRSDEIMFKKLSQLLISVEKSINEYESFTDEEVIDFRQRIEELKKMQAKLIKHSKSW